VYLVAINVSHPFARVFWVGAAMDATVVLYHDRLLWGLQLKDFFAVTVGVASDRRQAKLRIRVDTTKEAVRRDGMRGEGPTDVGSGRTALLKWWFGGVLFVLLLGLRASAQIEEFLPEIDVQYKVSRDVRMTFQAKETREGGDPTQAEIGPSIAFYLKPLVKLKKVTVFDLNDAKSRPLVLSIGYRYLPSPESPSINRVEPVANLHFPTRAGFLVTDRNRADLDWKSDKFSWRYRNRLQIERRFAIFSCHPAPYASVEFFYQSQYRKWSDTAIYGGWLVPLGRHVEFDPYYEHQNNTGKKPNQQLNQFGIAVSLYF